MKLCSRLLMFFVEISAKNNKNGYLNCILGKLGVTLVDGSLESQWSTVYLP